MQDRPNGTKVIVFAGLPGTGKSTLAELVATAIGVPAFAADWILGAMKPFGVLGGLGRRTFLDLTHRLLETLATRQLILNQSVILDCVLTDPVATRWRDNAVRFGAQLHLVECVCTDPELHRMRMAGREPAADWQIGWDSVEGMRGEFPPLTQPRLTVDAVNPVTDNARLVLEYIQA